MADSKITGLTADTTPTSTDLVVTVDDVAGTPTNKKVTIGDLATALAAMSGMTAAFAPKAARVCRVYRSAALTLANNGQTPISWDAETVDTDAMHDLSTNPERVTLNKLGFYQCNWQIAYDGNATGVRDASLALNGSVVSVREQTATTAPYIHGSDIVKATAITDYVEVWPFQNSGGTRSFTVGSTSTYLSVVYLGT